MLQTERTMYGIYHNGRKAEVREEIRSGDFFSVSDYFFYYKNGKDLTEHFSYEGSVVICIESTLKHEPTRLMVEALEPSIVYMLPYDRLLKATETSHELDMFYRKILEYSLIVSQIKADSWRFETASERYHNLLKHHPEVIKRAPMAHIASYLLMTPETLSRVRSNIQ